MSALPQNYMVIEPMQLSDLRSVSLTEEQIYDFPWTLGNFADSLSSGNSMWVMRDARGELLAYAVMLLVLDEAHLLNLGVVKTRQRHGYGANLLMHLFEIAKNSGAIRMFLEVRPSNEAGRALYRKFGFNQIGRRPGYYPAHDGREDALILACDI